MKTIFDWNKVSQSFFNCWLHFQNLKIKKLIIVINFLFNSKFEFNNINLRTLM